MTPLPGKGRTEGRCVHLPSVTRCLDTLLYVCTCVPYICTYTGICVYYSLRTRVCTCVCAYAYVYIYTYIHVRGCIGMGDTYSKFARAPVSERASKRELGYVTVHFVTANNCFHWNPAVLHLTTAAISTPSRIVRI